MFLMSTFLFPFNSILLCNLCQNFFFMIYPLIQFCIMLISTLKSKTGLFRKWCQFKNVYEKEKAEILAIENEDKRQEELDKLNATQDEWKLRAMGTTIGCHTIVKKGTEGNDIKTYDLT